MVLFYIFALSSSLWPRGVGVLPPWTSFASADIQILLLIIIITIIILLIIINKLISRAVTFCSPAAGLPP